MASSQPQLSALSTYLRERREQLLGAWRKFVDKDPELTTSSSSSRIQLDDHLPGILDTLEARLRAENALDDIQIDLQQRNQAAEHGVHRWRQGYDFREGMREWGHLQFALFAELGRYFVSHPDLDRAIMASARTSVAALCIQGSLESATRYLRPQQAEAAGRMRDLQASVDALQKLENERAGLLHEAAHDLRGSMSVVDAASTVLAQRHVEPAQREHFQKLLKLHIHSMVYNSESQPATLDLVHTGHRTWNAE